MRSRLFGSNIGVIILSLTSLLYGADALYSGASKEYSLVKPFDLGSKWKTEGDVSIGNDVVILAQKPGQEGGIWSSNSIPYEEWTIEAKVRVVPESSTSEPDRSGLTIWWTDSPLQKGVVHGGADLWDGLAVMMDSLGPDGHGAIRGHLNDGSYRFEASTDLSEDALSMCLLKYREMQVFTTIRIGYGKGVFAVDINGQKCFLSTDITLGPGYLGATANTAASKDKFYLESLSITEGIAQGMLDHVPAGRLPAAELDAPDSIEVGVKKAAVSDMHEKETIDPKVVNKPILDAIDQLNTRIDSIAKAVAHSAGAGAGTSAPGGSGSSSVAPDPEVLSRLHNIESSIATLVEITNKLASSHSSSGVDVSTELQNLRTQINDHQKSLPDFKSSSGTDDYSIFKIVAIVLVAQLVVVFAALKYWERQQRHQKLL